MNGKLLFIPLSFPYSIGNEDSFIANELTVLASNFEEVVILPTLIGGRKYNVPENCTIDTKYAEFLQINKTKSLTKQFLSGVVSKFFINEFLLNITNYMSFRKLIRLILYTSRLKVRIKWFENKIKKSDYDAIYTYWFTIDTNAIALSTLSSHTKVITRAHGIDVYDFRNISNTYYKNQVLNRLFLVANISNNGRDYFRNKYPEYRKVFQTFYLGVLNKSIPKPYQLNNSLNILSCSSIIKIKRVNKIYEAVLLYSKQNKININWTHIGGGELLEELKLIVGIQAYEGLTISLMGEQTNEYVFDFYRNNHVDLFIHLSETEGLPVVMMEACSFGIPIIATNVGGVSEIVIDNRNGYLLSADPTSEEVVEKIDRFCQLANDKKIAFREFSREHWYNNFNAATCFENFYQKIISL